MKKAGFYLLLASQVAVIVAFWLHFHVYHPLGNQLTGDISGQMLAWGRLAGLLAAFLVLLQLMLVGRVKWIETVFGLDRLTRLHHVLGFSLISLILAHPVLVTYGHSINFDVSYSAQVADFWKNWDDVPGAMVGTALFMAVIAVSAAIVIWRKLRYEVWYGVHLLVYLALALAFGHQLAVGADLTGSRLFANYWIGLYIFCLGNLVIYRLIMPLWNFARQRFTVINVEREADDVTSVYIEGIRPERFCVKAGQFMIVRFLAKGFRWEEHPFSLSCKPGGRQIRLTIKNVGDYTKRIPLLKPGTKVIIDGPHGVFIARQCAKQKVLMVAGGIGITPIRSLVGELLQTGHEIVLIYGNRKSNSIVFKDELDDLAQHAENRLRIVHVMSDDPAWPGETGRIDNVFINRVVPDVKDRYVYLCGPPPMMKQVRSALITLGVPTNMVRYERFAL